VDVRVSPRDAPVMIKREKPLEDFLQNSLHDIRHTFGSSGPTLAQDVPVIGYFLDHNPSQIMRYAPLTSTAALTMVGNISENPAKLLDCYEASRWVRIVCAVMHCWRSSLR
jgi:hypothetical protein